MGPTRAIAGGCERRRLANRVSLAEIDVLLTGDRPGRGVEVDPVRIPC
jgi:hypothetical protein